MVALSTHGGGSSTGPGPEGTGHAGWPGEDRLCEWGPERQGAGRLALWRSRRRRRRPRRDGLLVVPWGGRRGPQGIISRTPFWIVQSVPSAGNWKPGPGPRATPRPASSPAPPQPHWPPAPSCEHEGSRLSLACGSPLLSACSGPSSGLVLPGLRGLVHCHARCASYRN